MGQNIQFFLFVIIIQILVIAGETDPRDVVVLYSIKASWQNLPPDWVGLDPCGSGWDGINCTNSRVTSLILQGNNVMGTDFGDIPSLSGLQYLDLSNNRGLKGTLPSSIGSLKNLLTLLLVGCSFFGPLPESLGSLQNLVYLSLNNNSFSGPIPNSFGNLSKLKRLDLSRNKLSGSLPVSVGNLSGLDMLTNTQHFHFGANQLSGPIPNKLFSSSMTLKHLVLDNNQLAGVIPDTLGYVQTLTVLRLDSNFLNGPAPPNLNNLTNLTQLYLSNNNLIGAVPDLTGMNFLFYVDLSNNSFSPPSVIPPWFTTISTLVTLLMERTQIQGEIPANLFNSTNLVTVVLSNNKLSGTLELGASNSNHLRLLDLQNNSITKLQQSTGNATLKLAGNPICDGIQGTASYCAGQKTNFSYITPTNNCKPTFCKSNEILSPLCKCVIPYTGTLHFIFFSFLNDNSSYIDYLKAILMSAFLKDKLPVASVVLSNPTIDTYFFREFTLNVFPSGQDYFNRKDISAIGTLLNSQPAQITADYGPFYFTDESYPLFGVSTEVKSSLKTGIIIGAVVSSSVLVLLLLCVGLYALRQRRRVKRALADNTFASLNHEMRSDSFPRLKGARCFSFEELKKCTDNFSESKYVGSGGYGKVYRGTLDTGQLVAIKRAQQGSLQGANEFKTEIELLSRIHHKNLVGLVGFCYNKGEQMLIYEYIPNGTLRESLSGKSGIRLDWMRRLRVALDSARGLAYLHELANPPVIHRDVKSSNILLDENLSAKVADFGLSKLIDDAGKGYISTQVKGTLGYMDPEYYMTQQLTQKSDVYSFGIVLLELITGRKPIDVGKYIVREVKEVMDKARDPSELREILDPKMGWGTSLVCLEKFLDLAMSCVGEISRDRPKMGEVVREIENIIHEAGSNLTDLMVFSPSSFEEKADNRQSKTSFEEKTDDFDSSFDFIPFHVQGH